MIDLEVSNYSGSYMALNNLTNLNVTRLDLARALVTVGRSSWGDAFDSGIFRICELLCKALGLASLTFPASFMLLASMNPCHCGYLGHPTRPCTCSKRHIYEYRRKVSGPLLERIDLHIEADSIPLTDLFEQAEPGESSETIRQRVIHARYQQYKRFGKNAPVHCNAQIPDPEIETNCPMEPSARRFLLKKMDELHLSVRSYMRIVKVARTIADLATKDTIELPHVAEALHFRSLDTPLSLPVQKNNKYTR